MDLREVQTASARVRPYAGAMDPSINTKGKDDAVMALLRAGRVTGTRVLPDVR